LNKLEGWKKMGLGALFILAGAVCMAIGEKDVGWKLIVLGAGIFVGGNIVDKVIKNGNKK
jgi:hypothetical protein